MVTRCARAKWRIRAAASPSLCGTSSAASFSPGTSSSWPEGRTVLLPQNWWLWWRGPAQLMFHTVTIYQQITVHTNTHIWLVVSVYLGNFFSHCEKSYFVVYQEKTDVFCVSYASIWKGCLTLYTGRGGDLQKIGEWVVVKKTFTSVYFVFVLEFRLSFSLKRHHVRQDIFVKPVNNVCFKTWNSASI